MTDEMYGDEPQPKPKAKRKLFAKAMVVMVLIVGGAFVLPWQNHLQPEQVGFC